MSSKILRILLTVVLLLFAGAFFAKKINLVVLDLGRHIKNGELFLSGNTDFLFKNIYSYTEPNFPVVTHHWGVGVVFYLFWKYFGFAGLSAFYIFISVATVFCFFRFAWKKTSLEVAFIITTLLLPLIANRTEIRPEGVSYFLLGVFLLLLDAFRQGKMQFKLLLPLALFLQIVWVNCHIFFILGIFLVGLYFLEALLISKSQVRLWGILFSITIITCVINPRGLAGLLEPLTIFKSYGYMLVENQSVFFMQKRAPKFLYFHTELAFLLVLFSGLYVFLEKKYKLLQDLGLLPGSFAVIVFGILALCAIRGIPVFGLFLIPFLSVILYSFVEKNLLWQRYLLVGGVLLLLMGMGVRGHYYSSFGVDSGLGLLAGSQESVEFLKKNKISGPIFNNYDIGGYLIFHLFPRYRVFVDNRPEAYSVGFFKVVYIPMQESAAVWERISEQYKFNVIFFYRHDATPWAQPFLIERIQDSNWVPVFVDDYVLILVRNVEENSEVIAKYALPLETFVIQ